MAGDVVVGVDALGADSRGGALQTGRALNASAAVGHH